MSGLSGFSGWVGTVLGTPDPAGLGRFYAGLIGGDLDEGDPGFVTLHQPGSTTYLAFQLEDAHQPPVWPAGPGEQQMQCHLDLGVRDVSTAVDEATRLGASLADHQPQENVRVMLDPAGHPFCLTTVGAD